VVLLASLSAAALSPATGAKAAGDCDVIDNVVTIYMEFDGTTVVTRSGDDILIDGALCDALPGEVTVHTMSGINFEDNFGHVQTAVISLANGPFAPGLDIGSSPEMDFTYDSTLNLCDNLKIVGGPASDYVRWGGSFGAQVANLNADEADGIDADLSAGGCVRVRTDGGLGGDVLRAVGGLGTGQEADYFVTFFGGAGADILSGGANGGDRLYGGPGSDTIAGRAGSDIALLGEDGNDSVNGGTGSDSLNGGAGRDVLVGGDGADRLNGGTGVDVCRGGPGKDTFVNCETIVS